MNKAKSPAGLKNNVCCNFCLLRRSFLKFCLGNWELSVASLASANVNLQSHQVNDSGLGQGYGEDLSIPLPR
jgi:hypothetical protein